MSFDEHIEEGLKIKQPYTSQMHTAINHRARQQPLQAATRNPSGPTCRNHDERYEQLRHS